MFEKEISFYELFYCATSTDGTTSTDASTAVTVANVLGDGVIDYSILKKLLMFSLETS